MKEKYASDVKLGDRYRDSQTGFEGVATAIYFFQYGCERVSLEKLDTNSSEIRSLTFDSPRLIHVETEKVPRVTRTGGPGDGHEGRPAISGRAEATAR